ncbi:MAG TPA: hypothetical protein VML55_04025, partial [Planctomycetaceae bacterium]|nr:hypothetical protein [Planctomycetaceae bacterium]
MTHELLYTSAPQGLKPGSRGFCTVEMTDGIPPGLVDRLESLSAYRQAFPIHDPRAKDNPVNCSHLIVPAGGKRFHVLSRVADAGQDYTGRSNKLAHHVAIEPHERPAGNPAWVLRSPGFSQTSWNGTPRVLPSGRRAPSGTRGPAVCHAWKQAAGDAGWAGVLVASAVEPGAKPVSVIYPAGMDVLPLVEEALALVPGDRQWEVTFSTYFTKLPAGIDCQWRFILDDTPEARMLRRNAHAEVIDLCRTLGPPPPPRREFADLARRGRICVREGTPPPCPPPSPPPSAPPPIERSPRRLPLEPAPAAPASALVRVAVAAPSSFALSGGLPPDPSAASPDAPFPPASFPPASPPPPPPPSTQRAVEPPPDASADVTYGLLRNGPPPRTPASRATAADPWARRSPEQLVISPSEARGGTSSRRWAGRAALALAAVAAVAATAYVLGRGSHSNARHRPVGAQASNTGRPRDAAVQASPDSIRPRPQANPNDRTATAPPPGRNDASKSSNAPAAVSIHAAGSTPLPPLPDFYSQGSQAAYVPGTSLSEPPSNRAHGSPPVPLQQDNRLPYVVIGSARLVFESHRGNDQRDSGSGSANHLRLDDWLIVLPGAVA